jgi:hypothetical protein
MIHSASYVADWEGLTASNQPSLRPSVGQVLIWIKRYDGRAIARPGRVKGAKTVARRTGAFYI